LTVLIATAMIAWTFTECGHNNEHLDEFYANGVFFERVSNNDKTINGQQNDVPSQKHNGIDTVVCTELKKKKKSSLK
jgi:hypothetical protein